MTFIRSSFFILIFLIPLEYLSVSLEVSDALCWCPFKFALSYNTTDSWTDFDGFTSGAIEIPTRQSFGSINSYSPLCIKLIESYFCSGSINQHKLLFETWSVSPPIFNKCIAYKSLSGRLINASGILLITICPLTGLIPINYPNCSFRGPFLYKS